MDIKSQFFQIAKDLTNKTSQILGKELSFTILDQYKIIITDLDKELVLDLKSSYVQTVNMKEYRFTCEELDSQSSNFPLVAIINLVNADVSYANDETPYREISKFFTDKSLN